MFQHKEIRKLDDFFVNLESRPERGVYFYRINGYTGEIARFIQKYYETAGNTGIVIEGKIPNPDEKNLAYYHEIMGMDFQVNPGFFSSSLKKWLPRMKARQRENVALSMYDSLAWMRKAGKNENMQKNAYIKFMCWLYYRFERMMNLLGENALPKILYEGTVSNYELMLLSILSNAGCDVVLLQYHGDAEYLKLDAASALSDCLQLPDMKPFPDSFRLSQIREQMRRAADNELLSDLRGKKPALLNCTNAWISGNALEDIKKCAALRGGDPNLFYNCFCRINGVEDRLTYVNELYQFHLELKNSKRRIVIIDEAIPPPTVDEIEAVRRKNYARQEQMLLDLSANIRYTPSAELQRLMVKAFTDVLLMEMPNASLNKLTGKAVYLLCWLKRYQWQLFGSWKQSDVGCLIDMGGCRNANEALFLKLLARLPVDVLILCPDLNQPCCLTDNLLYEMNYKDTLAVSRFPQDGADVQIGTAAYHAERELDALLYQDSGIYRNKQYTKADSVVLQTTYEEIKILWNQEMKYRPNFGAVNDVVELPVIFAKASGVKNGALPQYWASIRELMVEDTLVISSVPYIQPTGANPMKAYAAEFFKNGRLQRAKIKGHPNYRYGFIREEMQNHMLDKLQLLIDRKLMKGTFEIGTEYTIIATALNLPKEVMRMIQKFDFTKKNPKLIFINTGERTVSLEDAIFAAYLHLAGFDVMIFAPTGYQSFEKHFNRKIMEEHQIGDYMYDLQVPDLAALPFNTRPRWRDRIFGKK